MPFSDSFRAARWVRTLNLVLQAVLFLTFFAGLNYVAHNHPALRVDLTRNRSYSLSPETLSYLHNLPRPVHVVVTMTDESRSPELRGLLEEFRHATEENPTGRITVEYLDVYQDRRRAEQAGIETADVVLLKCGDKPRAIPIDELYQTKDLNGKPERVAFLGEQKLTAALLDVSSSTRQQVYFLVGHGELRPDDPNEKDGLSIIRDQLRVRNFDVDTLELAVARKIPKDDALLIIVDPQSRYTPAEEEMLRAYLRDKSGRLIMFLGPGKPVTELGLDDLLLDWGVLVDDDVIVDPRPDNTADNGDLMVRALDEKHPITQALVSRQFGPLRLGLTRSVQPDPGRSLGSGLTVVALAAASPAAWGERSWGKPGPIVFNPGIDIRPLPGMAEQLGIAVASERVAVKDNLPFSVRSGRMVVFGTGTMLANSRIAIAGNLAMFFGAVNWCVDRDRQLNVPARPIERFQLALSASDLHRLNYSLWFVLPGITALLGLVVYWTRRT